MIFVNHFITASEALLTPCLLTRIADSHANPPLTGTKKAPPATHTHTFPSITGLILRDVLVAL